MNGLDEGLTLFHFEKEERKLETFLYFYKSDDILSKKNEYLSSKPSFASWEISCKY